MSLGGDEVDAADDGPVDAPFVSRRRGRSR